MKKALLAEQLRTFRNEAGARANNEAERSLLQAIGDYSAEMLYGLRTKVRRPSPDIILLEGKYKRAGIRSPGISVRTKDGQIQSISLFWLINYGDNSFDWLIAPGIGNINFNHDGTIKVEDGAEGYTKEEILANVSGVLRGALDRKANLRRFR